MKQALLHGAIVQDLVADPLPPPHPELTKYFESPKNVLKRAKEAIDGCKTAFAAKKGVNRPSTRLCGLTLSKCRKESHVRERMTICALKTVTTKYYSLIV